MNKIEGAKELIKSADSIYEDFLIKINIKKFELYDDDELKRKINQYATLYAQICEYYLKALVLPNLTNSNYEMNSDEEMNFLAVDRNGLRKYNHIFKKIINSSEFDDNIKKNIEKYLLNHLSHIELERKEIIKKICQKEGIEDITKYEGATFHLDNNSHPDIFQLLDIICGERGFISNNSNAYPESRYAMISNYIADLSFLSVFCDAIRDSLKLKFGNCLKVKGSSRHIFPDVGTIIEIVFNTGNIQKMLFDENDNLWVINDNGEKIDIIGYVWNYDMASARETYIDKIYFTENGKKRIFLRDESLEQYIFSNINSKSLESNIGSSDLHIVRK